MSYCYVSWTSHCRSLLGGIRGLGPFLVLYINKVIGYHTVQMFGPGKILKEVHYAHRCNIYLITL